VNITVLQSPLFSRQKKKLYKKQIEVLDNEIRKIIKNPEIGEAKKGDLKGVWVHRFKMGSQLFLLAYEWTPEVIYLLAINTHEGFYKRLKGYLK